MAMSSRANYTMNEVLLLTSLVDARRHVLENKATQNDLELQDAQKSGWVVLCAEYNAHEECTTNRTVKQLSEKWDTLKTKAKGAQTAAHKELSKTGKGVPNQDSEIPPHLEAVLAVIELQLQRWVGVFR